MNLPNFPTSTSPVYDSRWEVQICFWFTHDLDQAKKDNKSKLGRVYPQIDFTALLFI